MDLEARRRRLEDHGCMVASTEEGGVDSAGARVTRWHCRVASAAFSTSPLMGDGATREEAEAAAFTNAERVLGL